MKKMFGCLAATMALAGAGLLGTTSTAAAQTGDLTQAQEEAQAQPAGVPHFCDVGVIADRYDNEPKMYGSSWISCGYGSIINLQVTLTRDGTEVGRDLCSVVDGFDCTATTTVSNPAGEQRWEACATVQIKPAGGPEWHHQECTATYY